jgi:RNA polymerase sigma factor (sigma-70 family)
MSNGDISTQLYVELDSQLRPLVRRLSLRFALAYGVEADDAEQEARMALFEAFRHYDYNRGRGGVKKFARTTIRNAFRGLAYAAVTRSRCPHTVYVDEDGQERVVRHSRLASLEDVMDSSQVIADGCGESELDVRRATDRLRVLRVRLYRALRPRERAIFKLKAQPPEDFLVFLRNIGVDSDANNVHIARYLGISKNAVDYSLLKIRGEFRRLAESEFSDLIAGLIRDGEWPMVHVSFASNDVEFVRAVLLKRSLDPRPLSGPRDVRVKGEVGRIIERYHWGAILHLKLRCNVATVVVEGHRFNESTGDVFGSYGMWRPLTDEVPWYKTLVREIS